MPDIKVKVYKKIINYFLTFMFLPAPLDLIIFLKYSSKAERKLCDMGGYRKLFKVYYAWATVIIMITSMETARWIYIWLDCVLTLC